MKKSTKSATPNERGSPDPAYLEACDRIARQVASKVSFGYFTKQDIYQESWAEGLIAWESYDPTRPPDPYLATVVWSRIRNKYRDLCHRSDSPCKSCHEGNHSVHPDEKPCEPYLTWKALNSAKLNLMNAANLEDKPVEVEAALAIDGGITDEVSGNELENLIDRHLSSSLRSDYARLVNGLSLPKARRLRVQEAVAAILDEHSPEGWDYRG